MGYGRLVPSDERLLFGYYFCGLVLAKYRHIQDGRGHQRALDEEVRECDDLAITSGAACGGASR